MPDCRRCGDIFLVDVGERGRLSEPWCKDCRRGRTTEYASIRAAWVRENAEAVLTDMGVPPRYCGCTLENFEAHTRDQRRVLQVVEGWFNSDELGLFLCGPPGTGKTHLAVAAMLKLRATGILGRFAAVQEFLSTCRGSFQRHSSTLDGLIEEHCGRDLVLLDDLGTENSTNFSRETVGHIIDLAYKYNRPLIATSNYRLEELFERLDDRTVDRLIDLCLPVKFVGSSYRQKRASERAGSRSLATSEMLQ